MSDHCTCDIPGIPGVECEWCRHRRLVALRPPEGWRALLWRDSYDKNVVLAPAVAFDHFRLDGFRFHRTFIDNALELLYLAAKARILADMGKRPALVCPEGAA